MNTSLKVITAPSVEPVTAAEVKLQVHIDHSTEDALINTWITAGREQCEDYHRRAYITQVLELSFDDWPPVPFNLPMAPLQQVMTIKYTDVDGATYTLYNSGEDPTATSTTSSPDSGNSNFIIDTDSDPGRVMLADSVNWPTAILQSINSFKVRYAAGYGDAATSVPAVAKNAILLYCGYCNENRAGEVPEMPAHILNLLRPTRGSKLIWEG